MRLSVALLTFIFQCSMAFAIDSPAVLPKGIRSLSVKFGNVSGLNQYYTEGGQLAELADDNTVSFDVTTTARYEEEVTDLVDVLNQFGPDNLGDQLFLGNLSVNADPELNYMAPIFAYGVNKRFTVALGVPVINFRNQVDVGLNNSNIAALRAEFDGASADLDEAFDRASADIKAEFRQELSDKGYKPLDDKDDTFVGDVQLISAYMLKQNADEAHSTTLYINLPTGPEPDADDLTDPEIFGRLSFKPTYAGKYILGPKGFLLGSASYQYVVPGKVEKRVPLNDDDSLPGKEQKQELEEDIGDTWSVMAGAGYKHNSNWTTTVAVQHEEKQQDRYSNSNVGNSAILEQNTRAEANIGKIELGYSTVDDYFAKKAAIPMDVYFEISTVMSGVNIENQTRHELWLMMYF